MNNGNELKILFVEDLPTDMELAGRQLRSNGVNFNSIRVDSREDFLDALDTFHPELIISDYSMPGFDGMQALQIVLQKCPEIPFIVLTGSMNEDTAVECMKAGAADYVIKEHINRLPFAVRETMQRAKDRQEKILAENKLKESEEKFRIIFESANVGKAVTNASETISVNDSLAEMLGYTKEELIKIPWEKLTYPDDYPDTREQVEALYRGEIDSVRYEKRYIHKEGYPVWVDISVKAHRNLNGNVEYIFSTIIDINEKRKAEEKLKASEEQYRLLVENQTDLIVKVDAEGRFLYVSPSYCRKFGKREEELIGQAFAPLVHEEDMADTIKAMEALNQPPHTCYIEQRALTKDGWRWLSWTDTALLDEQGNICEIIGLGSDITERKQVEIALRESESKFRLLFEDNLSIMLLIDPGTGIIIDANPIACKYYGYERDFLLTLNISQINILPQIEIIDLLRKAEKGEINAFHFKHKLANGEIRDVAVNSSPITHQGKTILLSIVNDVTASIQAEKAFKESEKRYRHLFDDSPIAIFEEDFSEAKHYLDALREKGVTDFHEYFTSHPEDLSSCVGLVKVIDVNKASLPLYGARNKEELLSELKKEIPLEDSFMFMNEIVNVANGLKQFYYETIQKDLKGRTLFLAINWAATPGYDEDLSKVILTLIDITKRKEAEQALRESEKRFRSLFEDSPVSIWEEDFSGVKKYLDQLQSSGVEDIAEYFSNNQAELMKVAGLIVVNDVNQETLILFGAESKEELKNSFTSIYIKKSLDQFVEELVHISKGKTHFDIDFTNRTLDGQVLEFTAKWAAQPGYENDLSKVLISMVDITDRKKAEDALRENEQRYRSLFDDSPVAIFEEDFSAVKIYIDELKQSGVKDFHEYLNTNPDELKRMIGFIKITDINKEAEKLYGFKSKQELNGNIELLTNPFNNQLMIDEMVNITEGKTKFQNEVYKYDSKGVLSYLTVNWAAVPGFEEDLSKVIVTVVDITERKELEKRQQQRLAEMEAIDKITSALRQASTKDEALPIFLQETLLMMQMNVGGIMLHNPTDNTLQVSHVVGLPQEMTSVKINAEAGIIGSVFLNGKSEIIPDFKKEFNIHNINDDHINVDVSGVCIPMQSQEITLGVILIVNPKEREIRQDEIKLLEAFARIAGITLQRMTLYEDTLSHLKQLQVQRSIDQTIASIFDLNLTLELICSQARNYLNANAVGILLFQPHEQILNYIAGNGFEIANYKNTKLPLSGGPAAKATLKREIVYIPDVQQSDPPFKFINILKKERFVSYMAVPLIAKGEIKGVMEIFYRKLMDNDPNLLEFVESLAFQTAIAIDNLQLFENLQQSNQELVQAYDATIEGWSRAMDLRDKETENHTRRVTDMAVRIARIMGVKEEEIVHIRRGALLHDIGKMGVPDDILLKPGPLTPEEWIIMKQHPVFAYEMIAPVDYLKPALDIPYCHHEKWDGSGYPRGLMGEEIPIAGRIFAVIDVWDALSSNRPYREAWPKQKVLAYIKDQSGTHFDPEIVKIFLEVVDSEEWSDEYWRS